VNDDRDRSGNRELFEAIVSQLEDPERAVLRRTFVALGVAAFLIAVVVLWLLLDLGGGVVLAFSATFVPGVLLAWRFQSRRFAAGRRRRR
jgi:hypothetical protein